MSLRQPCPTRGPHAASRRFYAAQFKVSAVVKVPYILTTSLYFDNLELVFFDAGSTQCHFHVSYHCSWDSNAFRTLS